MTQVTHFNEETLVRYLRAALQHLQQDTGLDNVYGFNDVTYNLEDALRDLNAQFPELSEKAEKFLHVVRATQPELLSHAKELMAMSPSTPVPSHLVSVNRLYLVYLSTLTHWEKA